MQTPYLAIKTWHQPRLHPLPPPATLALLAFRYTMLCLRTHPSDMWSHSTKPSSPTQPLFSASLFPSSLFKPNPETAPAAQYSLTFLLGSHASLPITSALVYFLFCVCLLPSGVCSLIVERTETKAQGLEGISTLGSAS